MKFQPETFFDEISYLGEFESVRQIYYIYKKEKDYMLVSLSRRDVDSFNILFIKNKLIKFVLSEFSGQEVTSKMVVEKDKKRLFGSLFDRNKINRFKVLGSLYVLCVLGKAKKLEKKEGKSLVFRVLK